MTWGGLRGGLSMVLVLALPKAFPHRELLVTMTFGVVILSILIQGLSMTVLLRRLGLTGVRGDRIDYERERGILRAKSAALSALERMQKDGAVHSVAAAQLRSEYEGAMADAEMRMKDLHLQAEDLREEEERATRRQLLLSEKDALLGALRNGYLSQDIGDQLLEDVDARLIQLESES